MNKNNINNEKIEKYEKEYHVLLKRRENKINDHFNKIVKYLFEEYKEKRTIIVGYNLNWKNRVNMGKKNNRTFYNIPYAKLIYKLKDKFGEKIIITEESYTSKCDGLAYEEICNHEEYIGKR